MKAAAKALQNDGIISIAVGSSRRCTQWQNREMLWSELAARLEIPTRTAESKEEYKALPKAKRDDIKDVGGFVGGVLQGGRRKADAIINRRLITLDLDNVPAGEDIWPAFELVIGCAAVLYSTHSHTQQNQRLRIVIPLSREVSPDEYAAISRRIAGDIGIDMCDDTTFEPHRLMYWPSASYDAPFRYEIIDGPWLDADEQLKRYTDWQDPTEWPVSSRKTEIMDRLAKKQGDPYEKPGVIGAFCRVYPIEDAIETFLPTVYTKYAEGRYTFSGGSTSGGLVLYEHGKFAYSHHGTDPVSGKLCNSFDLVRLHMFGDKDDDAKPGTAPNRLPSFQAMSELAVEDPAVVEDLNLHNLADIMDALDEAGDADSKDWVKQLTVSLKGNIEATIENALIILKNDPQIKDRYYFDAFRGQPVVCGDLPWQSFEARRSITWSDSDDSGLRMHLEKFYKITNTLKIQDAVQLAMVSASRHPVREYLLGLKWDGVPRADTLFIDYLGAEDNQYTREVTRKALIGAVARIMQPGCKHDHVLVLVGPQGCRKSTTLMKLGKTKWFSDSLYTMSGKDAFEQIQGYWIIEMGEMAATKKADLELIKQFISKQSDSYRAAYARRVQEHPRQCAFFGTTNDDEFMRDATGGRRFWPVAVTEVGYTKGDNITDEIIDQIWAEILVRYNAGEHWYLSAATEAMARQVQDSHTELNAKQGLIEDFLERLLPEDWDKRSLEERLMFLNGGFSDEEGTVRRERVCALEIWQELFNGDPKSFTPLQAREINGMLRRVPGWTAHVSRYCGPLYGRQRCFIRKETK